MLEAVDEIGQPLAREHPARQPERLDRRFDRVRLSFDLDQHVHARVRLEPNDGARELVLGNLAVDLPRELKPKLLENLLEASRSPRPGP